MKGIAALLGLSVLSAFVPGVPGGMVAAMIVACVVGLVAVRFHDAADTFAVSEQPEAGTTLRIARFCDDLAVALCVLALLYAVHPL
ncbi:MAG: hypothetical protein ABI927_07050 [Gaiellaceae bacterium]